MTAEERDQIILGAWQDRLRRTDGVPANLAKTYAAWLRGVIKQAAETLLPEAQGAGAGGGGEGGEGQGGQEGAA